MVVHPMIILTSVDFSVKRQNIGPNERSLGHSLNLIPIYNYEKKSIDSIPVNMVSCFTIQSLLLSIVAFSGNRTSIRICHSFLFSIGLFRFHSTSCSSWLPSQCHSLQTTNLVPSSIDLSTIWTHVEW